MARKISLIAIIAFAVVWLFFEIVGRGPGKDSSNSGQPAPDISIRPIGGASKDLHLSDLKGKVVLLDFWATWCGPCRMSMPSVEALYTKEHSHGFEVMGVALENDDGSSVPSVAKEIGVTYPVGLPESRDEVSRYSTGSIPLMVLVDKKGIVRWMQQGYAPSVDADLEQHVSGLLAE